MFFRQLSQLYRGLGPDDPPPYYEPEAIKFPEPSKPPSPTYHRYDLSAPPPWERPERKAMEFVAFRLTATQLTEIHNSVTKGVKTLRITRVDIVVGLLARCLSEVEPESKPIDTISYVVDVRGFVASPAARLILSQHRGMGIYPVNAVVNAVVWLSAGLQVQKGVDPCDSVLAHAAEIRKSREKLKDPKVIKDMVADVGRIQSRVAWDKCGQDVANTNEGSLVVNILWRWVSGCSVCVAAETIPHWQNGFDESTLWAPRKGHVSYQSYLMLSLRTDCDTEPEICRRSVDKQGRRDGRDLVRSTEQGEEV